MRPFITASSFTVAFMLASALYAQEAQTTTTTQQTTTAPAASPAVSPAAPPVTTTAAIVPGNPQGSLDLPAPEKTTSPVNRPLLLTSFIVLGGTYGASAIDAALSSRASDQNYLYYPIVGPWMDYANRGGCPSTGSCAGETGNKALLILDGVGQGLGALGMVMSLFLPEKSTRNWFLIGQSGVHAAPARIGTGYGLGAGGMF